MAAIGGAPLNAKFSFVGTWDGGSSSGTRNFSDRVLSLSSAGDKLLTVPESRGFAAQCQMVLDDTDTFFSGTFIKGDNWLEGYFWLRQDWAGTWYDIFTGYCRPQDWSQDYGKNKINLTLTSTIGQGAAAVVPYGNTSSAGLNNYLPWLKNQGTVVGQGTLLEDEGGTSWVVERVVADYRVANNKQWYANSFVWQNLAGTVNPILQPKLRVDQYLNTWYLYGTTGTQGTFRSEVSFRDNPDWLQAGEVLWMTVPWPTNEFIQGPVVANAGSLNLGTLWDFVAERMDLTWDADSRARLGTAMEVTQLAYSATDDPVYPNSLGMAPHYYGGEKWHQVMGHLMASIGASWSVNASGSLIMFVRNPNLDAVAGTFDFNNAYNTEWIANQALGARAIRVISDWDDREAEYMGTSVSEAAGFSGETLTLPARWLRGIQAPTLAERMQIYNSQYQKRLFLEVEGRFWDDLKPGQVVDIENIPYNVRPGCSGGVCVFVRFLVESRGYNWEADLVNIELAFDRKRDGFFDLSPSAGTSTNYGILNIQDVLW